ncbi:hypothetical protein WBK31_11015 [Nonomuraea sp. N2-4H]
MALSSPLVVVFGCRPMWGCRCAVETSAGYGASCACRSSMGPMPSSGSTAAHSRSGSCPASTRTSRASRSSTSIRFIADRSMTMPPSFDDRPDRPCPPLRTDSANPCSRA